MNNFAQTIKGFLFDHKNTKQIIAKNTFWLSAAEGVSRFFKFFLIVFVARILGATEYGKFSFAFAFATFFIVFSELGLDKVTLRELARDKTQETKFPAVFTLRLILTALMLLMIWAGSFFATHDLTIRFTIWILAFYIFFQTLKSAFLVFFEARQRMEYSAINQILESILLVGLGFFVLLRFPSVQTLSFVYALTALSGFLFVTLLLRKVQAIKLSFSSAIWKRFLSLSWPLALVGFTGAVFNQIDSITLGMYREITQVGWYNAAYAIFGAVLLPSMIIGQSFLPAVSRAFGRSKESLQKIIDFQMETSVFFAFGFLAGGLALAPRIIDFFYDPSYAPSVLALQILLVGAAFMILSGPLGQALFVLNQQQKLFWITLATSTFNAALDIVLIPHFSLYGPAFATSVSAGLMAFMTAFFALKALPPRGSSVLLSLIGALFSGLVTYLLLSLPQAAELYVLLSVFLGGLVYLAIFLGWRVLVIRILQVKAQQ